MDSLQSVALILLSALVFLVVITVLVGVHELGHYLLARLCGMKVDAFAIMMGGRRSTDLSRLLAKPLVPGSILWMVALASLCVLLAANTARLVPLYLASLATLGIALPVWVATRLAALYRLRAEQWAKTMGLAWVGSLGLLFLATRFQNVQPSQVIAILGMASLVGLLVLYYQPVAGRGEDAPMGEGSLQIDGSSVPVRFRPLWSRRSKDGTEFSMLLLPLGGFAAIRGMHPKPDGSETRIPGGFYSKPPWQRFIVLLAGPFFSVAFGVLLFAALYGTVGVYRPSNSPVVSSVLADKPAARAGLKAGDRFVRVDGQPVQRFYDVLRVIREKPGEPVRVSVLRDGKVLNLEIVPEASSGPVPVLGPDLMPTSELRVQAQMGVPIPRELVRLAPAQAFREAAMAPVAMVSGLLGIVRQPARASEEVGGPGTIALFAFEATKQGLVGILALAAGLSISLGIMNLLPIPPLDGGQMLVAFVEMLRRGRRLSIQVQNLVANVGFVLVLLLVFSVLAVDMGRIVGRKQNADQSANGRTPRVEAPADRR
ncbi:MAG: site-2 protease family protein [Fimbriimonadales bacterium]|nr:site-2 protease family protein [Fimbriimonadales bacterium]